MFGFKDVPGFEGLYSISDKGNVYSYLDQDFLKPIFSEGQGYFVKLLSQDPPKGRLPNQLGIYRYKLSKLVYETFKGRLSGADMVFHLNDDLLDNSIENLGVRSRYERGKKAAIEKVASDERIDIIDTIADNVCYIHGIDKEYLKSRTTKSLRIEAVKCVLWTWNQFVRRNLDEYPTVTDLKSTPCTYFSISRSTVDYHLDTSASLYKTYKAHKYLYDLSAKMFFENYEPNDEDVNMMNNELDKRLQISKLGRELVNGEVIYQASLYKPKKSVDVVMDFIYQSTSESIRKEIMSLFTDGFTTSYIDSKYNLKTGVARYIIERDFAPEEKQEDKIQKSLKRKMIAKREKYLSTSNSQQPGVVINRGKSSLSQY